MRDGECWVLVVEDDEDLRASIVALLDDEGYVARGASQGREALSMLAELPPPCVILLDLMMPQMTGDEFRRRQLADPRIAGVPVIVLSAMHDAATTARELRAIASVGKPLRLDELLVLVRDHCRPEVRAEAPR